MDATFQIKPLIIEEAADPLTGNIIGAAIEVHRALGPGLLESAYQACLLYELRLRRKTLKDGLRRMRA